MSKKVGLPNYVKFKHDTHFVDEISVRTRTEIIRNIPFEKIKPNTLQPRKDHGDLSELAESIKEKGILEPILVRPKNGQFEIIAGERRYRAAKIAGLKEIPCIEYNIADNEALELSIIENAQRKDLNIFESAYSMRSLSEIYGYTHQEISKKIGKSRVTVTELIRIADISEEVVDKCLGLKIDSKTFLLELVKIGSKEKMIDILNEYEKEPFSRDVVKEKRRKKEYRQQEREKKGLKFKFATEDKSVKINFNIKDEEINKEKIINILEKLIIDIKQDRIEDLKL